MVDGKIVVSKKDLLEVALETLEQMIDEETEIVTIIIGEEGSQEEAEKMEDALLAMNDELEIEIHMGDQPVYPYLFAAE